MYSTNIPIEFLTVRLWSECNHDAIYCEYIEFVNIYIHIDDHLD